MVKRGLPTVYRELYVIYFLDFLGVLWKGGKSSLMVWMGNQRGEIRNTRYVMCCCSKWGKERKRRRRRRGKRRGKRTGKRTGGGGSQRAKERQKNGRCGRGRGRGQGRRERRRFCILSSLFSYTIYIHTVIIPETRAFVAIPIFYNFPVQLSFCFAYSHYRARTRYSLCLETGVPSQNIALRPPNTSTSSTFKHLRLHIVKRLHLHLGSLAPWLINSFTSHQPISPCIWLKQAKKVSHDFYQAGHKSSTSRRLLHTTAHTTLDTTPYTAPHTTHYPVNALKKYRNVPNPSSSMKGS